MNVENESNVEMGSVPLKMRPATLNIKTRKSLNLDLRTNLYVDYGPRQKMHPYVKKLRLAMTNPLLEFWGLVGHCKTK